MTGQGTTRVQAKALSQHQLLHCLHGSHVTLSHQKEIRCMFQHLLVTMTAHTVPTHSIPGWTSRQRRLILCNHKPQREERKSIMENFHMMFPNPEYSTVICLTELELLERRFMPCKRILQKNS